MAFLGFSTFMTCRVNAQHQPLDANQVVMMDLYTVAVFIISSLLWCCCCCFHLFRLDDARLNLNKYTQYFHSLIGSKHTQNHGGNGVIYIYCRTLAADRDDCRLILSFFFFVLKSSPSILVSRNHNWSFKDYKARDWLRKWKVLAPLVRST